MLSRWAAKLGWNRWRVGCQVGYVAGYGKRTGAHPSLVTANKFWTSVLPEASLRCRLASW